MPGGRSRAWLDDVGCFRQCAGTTIPEKYRPTIKKGLEYLARSQAKDGHWGATGDQYPVAMTGLAGIALLMEGSTIREGPYKDHIRKATDWLLDKSQKQATARA